MFLPPPTLHSLPSGRRTNARRGQVSPTVCGHKLRPTLVETALVLFTHPHRHNARHSRMGAFITQAHLIIIRVTPGNGALAGRRGIIPVLHIVLFGQPTRPGVAYVVVPEDILKTLA